MTPAQLTALVVKHTEAHSGEPVAKPAGRGDVDDLLAMQSMRTA